MSSPPTTARPRRDRDSDATPSFADRIPPYDLGAEMALLASMIIDPQCIGPICMIVPTADTFYKEEHQVLFRVILELYEKNVPLDSLLVQSTLVSQHLIEAAGGYDYLKDILSSVPSAANAEHYAAIVREKAMLRRLIGACSDTLKEVYESGEDAAVILDRGEKRIFDIAQQKVSNAAVPLTDVLHETFEILDRNTGEHFTGVPSGFIELDNLTSGLQRGEMIIVAARPSVGKCLAHDAQIVTRDGAVHTIEELYRARSAELLTLGDDWKLRWTRPSVFVDDGIKPVFRVTTRSGRRIETTASHPFLTGAGWKKLADLQPGVEVAVPRQIGCFGQDRRPDCEITLLAYLLGDGNLTETCPRFTNSNPAIQQDFLAAVEAFGGAKAVPCETRPTAAPSWRIATDLDLLQTNRRDFGQRLQTVLRRQRVTARALAGHLGTQPSTVHYWLRGRNVPAAPTLQQLCRHLAVPAAELLPTDDSQAIRKNAGNAVTRWLTALGLMGKPAKDKFIPPFVFTLERPLVALFLNRLFATDGWATTLAAGNTQIGYASVSEQLIRQVQHLLLRFGIVASLRRRAVLYKGTRRPAWQLDITDAKSLETFLGQIGIHGKQEALETLRAALAPKRYQTNCDLLPMEVWDRVEAARGQRSWRAIAQAMGLHEHNSLHVRRRHLTRDRLAAFAEALHSDELRQLADSDVLWDPIVSIEPMGPKQVYDLTIPETHNFVANDICVHNTAFAMNIAEHVGVDLKKPLAVFSLEMSKQQLAQRMLCSRSNVDGHKLRRGMLSKQDRDALAYAVGELSQGQIFIDDTPGLSLMDLRTKARRLKLQYNIEMIVIDYLQLMEAPGAENRQQEIGQISRGVKALARELNVPVIALSQLNRASESEQRLPRTSDLRESGSIEQDADVVMLLHREAVMHRGDQEWMDANPDKINEAIIIVAKQRNGPCDNVKLTFLQGQTRFVNYNPGV